MYETKLNPDLIFDVGMHKGEDTAYYLKKGFSVIGFEADPELANHCRHLFTSEITANKLIIVEGAILTPDEHGDLPLHVDFFKNFNNSVWGTVVPAWAERNNQLGTSSKKISVPVINFVECLIQFGVPHYMKIDIEGMDSVCLKALDKFQQKPNYISVEAEKVNFNRLKADLQLFQELGYTRFKPVQQSGISFQSEPTPALEGNFSNHKFLEGSSGMFGKDLSGNWWTQNQTLRFYKTIHMLNKLFGDNAPLTQYSIGRFLIKVICKITGKPLPGWYDTHASRIT